MKKWYVIYLEFSNQRTTSASLFLVQVKLSVLFLSCLIKLKAQLDTFSDRHRMHSTNPPVPSALCFFFLNPCYCTSLPLPDGWSILLQHPVPVSFKPPRPSSRDGLFPTRTSTYHWRLISFSPCPDSEDVPAWRLSRGTARAQTSFSFRGQWGGGGSHEWVCVDTLKMQKAFLYLSIRLFPFTGVVSSGKQQTHYSYLWKIYVNYYIIIFILHSYILFI